MDLSAGKTRYDLSVFAAGFIVHHIVRVVFVLT